MEMEESIIGMIKDASAIRTKPTPDNALLALSPLVNAGIKEATTSITGMARNLAISLRLTRDLNSFKANANAVGSNHQKDSPLGM
jgi:hypothetical protein